jgi:T-complex protein 1 subunit delta
MSVIHPTARMLVEISKSQDIEAGDGTTTVVVIAGALLSACQRLLSRGIHPIKVSEGFSLALSKALEIIDTMAKPITLTDRQSLIESATTSLASKVVSQHSEILAPMAVDAVLKVLKTTDDDNVDLRDIHVNKKKGGTIDDSELIDGLCFVNKKASHQGGGPTRVMNAKVGLIQFCLSAPKTDMENNVVVHDYVAMDRILKEERRYIIGLIKKIADSGCNVLLIQKSILRDAVNDLSLHFLAKKNIMVIKDIERDQVEFISKTIGCTPIANIDQFTKDKLGEAAEVAENVEDKIIKFTGVKYPGKTVSILVRASNLMLLDEAERSFHDALCVVRSLVKKKSIVPGGACVEMEVA